MMIKLQCLTKYEVPMVIRVQLVNNIVSLYLIFTNKYIIKLQQKVVCTSQCIL
jgi:hypothetical protein